MSHEITCPNCETPNPPGSKFCNNCGHQLPKSPEIICPNCQTPNPRNRFYCDNCGTRLVQDTLPEEPDPEEKKSGAGVEAFNLPSRDPGQTANFDPNAIPDWLKTGELTSSQGEQEDESDENAEELTESDDLPPLEEVAPLGKSSEELPDWLVDEQLTSAPPFEPPEEINTDHFLELLQAEQLEDDELDEELAQAAEGANLPDWLDEAVKEEQSTPPHEEREGTEATESDTPSSPLAEEEDAGAPQEWLTQLGPLPGGRELSTDELSVAESSQGGEEEEAWDEEPGWLTGDAPEAEKEEEEFANGSSGIFSTSEFADQVFGGDELPDWLDDLEPEEENSGLEAAEEEISPAFAAESTADKTEDLPDWLTEAEEIEEEDASPGAEEETVTGWLSELEEEEITSELSEAREEINLTAEEDLVPDWLSELEEDEDTSELPAATEDVSAAAEEEIVTGWLGELEEAQEVSESREAPEDASPPAAEETSPVAAEKASPPAEFDAFSEPGAEPDDSEPLLDDLPDWLGELEAAKDEDSAEPDQELADLFPSEEEAAQVMPDWFQEEAEEVEEEEPIAAEEEAPAPSLEETLAEPDVESGDVFADDASMVEEVPDWLTELSAADSDEAVVTDADLDQEFIAAEEPEAVADKGLLSEEQVIEAEEATPSEEITAAEEEEAEEPGPAERLFQEEEEIPEAEFEAEEGELPEWLTQLDAAESAATEAREGDVLSGGELPEWLSRLRPEEGEDQERVSQSGLGAIDTELPPEFDDIPDELIGANLPDWLEEATLSKPALSDEEDLLFIDDQSEIPDWLRKDADAIDVETAPGAASREELNELIASLPPARHPAEELVKADLPDWVQAMQPRQEEEDPDVFEEEAAPSTGPLSGIRGAIDIQPIIAEPYTSAPAIPTFIFTEEQQRQGALLRQVSQTTPLRGGRIAPLGGRTLPAPLRLGLAILLLLIILLGLLGPNLLRPVPASAPEPVTAVHEILEDAAGQPVLVAFEYTPAMAAELGPQADLLLSQLAANESEVIIASQYPAGLALADAATADQPRQSIGYIPGEAIGLRELGNCLGASGACSTITTHSLSPDLEAAIKEVEVVVLLTGDRDSLLNWIEQVGSIGRVTLVAGITQALQPVAQPYLATAQLGGLMAGAPDTAVYAAAFDNEATSDLAAQWNAQHLAQILAAILLIVGGIVYGIPRNGDQEQSRKA